MAIRKAGLSGLERRHQGSTGSGYLTCGGDLQRRGRDNDRFRSSSWFRHGAWPAWAMRSDRPCLSTGGAAYGEVKESITQTLVGPTVAPRSPIANPGSRSVAASDKLDLFGFARPELDDADEIPLYGPRASGIPSPTLQSPCAAQTLDQQHS